MVVAFWLVWRGGTFGTATIADSIDELETFPPYDECDVLVNCDRDDIAGEYNAFVMVDESENGDTGASAAVGTCCGVNIAVVFWCK